MTWTLAQLKSYKKSNYRRPEIKDFKDIRINSLKSKGQTKDLNRKRYLNKLYSKINRLKKSTALGE